MRHRICSLLLFLIFLLCYREWALASILEDVSQSVVDTLSLELCRGGIWANGMVSVEVDPNRIIVSGFVRDAKTARQVDKILERVAEGRLLQDRLEIRPLLPPFDRLKISETAQMNPRLVSHFGIQHLPQLPQALAARLTRLRIHEFTHDLLQNLLHMRLRAENMRIAMASGQPADNRGTMSTLLRESALSIGHDSDGVLKDLRLVFPEIEQAAGITTDDSPEVTPQSEIAAHLLFLTREIEAEVREYFYPSGGTTGTKSLSDLRNPQLPLLLNRLRSLARVLQSTSLI